MGDSGLEVMFAAIALDLGGQGRSVPEGDEIFIPKAFECNCRSPSQPVAGAHGDPKRLAVELLDVQLWFIQGQGDKCPIQFSIVSAPRLSDRDRLRFGCVGPGMGLPQMKTPRHAAWRSTGHGDGLA